MHILTYEKGAIKIIPGANNVQFKNWRAMMLTVAVLMTVAPQGSLTWTVSLFKLDMGWVMSRNGNNGAFWREELVDMGGSVIMHLLFLALFAPWFSSDMLACYIASIGPRKAIGNQGFSPLPFAGFLISYSPAYNVCLACLYATEQYKIGLGC